MTLSSGMLWTSQSNIEQFLKEGFSSDGTKGKTCFQIPLYHLTVCVSETECVRYCRCVGGAGMGIGWRERERSSESFPEQTTSTAWYQMHYLMIGSLATKADRSPPEIDFCLDVTLLLALSLSLSLWRTHTQCETESQGKLITSSWCIWETRTSVKTPEGLADWQLETK